LLIFSLPAKGYVFKKRNSSCGKLGKDCRSNKSFLSKAISATRLNNKWNMLLVWVQETNICRPCCPHFYSTLVFLSAVHLLLVQDESPNIPVKIGGEKAII